MFDFPVKAMNAWSMMKYVGDWNVATYIATS